MSTKHSMLKNSNTGLTQANTAAYIINYQGMCKNAHLQWQMGFNFIKNIL